MSNHDDALGGRTATRLSAYYLFALRHAAARERRRSVFMRLAVLAVLLINLVFLVGVTFEGSWRESFGDIGPSAVALLATVSGLLSSVLGVLLIDDRRGTDEIERLSLLGLEQLHREISENEATRENEGEVQ